MRLRFAGREVQVRHVRESKYEILVLVLLVPLSTVYYSTRSTVMLRSIGHYHYTGN